MSKRHISHAYRVKSIAKVVALAVAFCVPGSLMAQELIGSYTAFIGNEDLVNPKGARLKQPWQVLQQDRDNYHRFGISQPGDEWDVFFGSIKNRQSIQQMARNGSIAPQAAKRLMSGNAAVFVRIYGQGSTGSSLEVTVSK